MDERWTADQVEALAPDAASRKAGARLAAPGPWSAVGAGDRAVWGRCSGSGKRPYQTVVDLSGPAPAFACSCPSRKFPCKHALGLLLLWARGGVPPTAAPGEGAEWAAEWLEKRRARAERGAAPGRPGGGAGRAPADPQAAARRAERRAQRVAAGASELERRLADLLSGGLAGADRAGYARWEETAARMVDAQAPGLATRVRELGSAASSGAEWPSRLLEESALLHLLVRGYQGVAGLPAPLAATVRSRVGFTTETAELLAGPRVRDHWLVLAQRDAGDDRLTTRRIWLHGTGTGRAALLLAFGAAGRAPETTLPVGRLIDADLAFHPAARPLRAVLGERHAAPAEPTGPPPGVPVAAALASYGAAVADDPWLDAWPVVLAGVVPIPGETGWQVADADGPEALPVVPRAEDRTAHWRLAALSGGRPVTVFGTLGHRGFQPVTAWTESPEAVPL
jgi:hypothetical protein